MDSDIDERRNKAYNQYAEKLAQHRQLEAEVKKLRENQKDLKKKYEKTEDDLKALQSVGQIIGEILKQLDDERFVIKASSGPRYVTGVRRKIDKSKLTPGTRVTLDMTTLTIMKILPREVDPSVFNMIEPRKELQQDITGFSEVGGLTEQIRQLRESIELPLINPEIFTRVGIDAPKGCLLYGPPGTGKTLLARAIASNIDANFLKVVASAIVDKYIGESARIIREMFGYARDHQPCFIKGTKVCMYDGSLKNVEDIQRGDFVLGPDSKPREVKSLSHGFDNMYLVSDNQGDQNICEAQKLGFICNSRHKLALQTPTSPRIIEESEKDQNYTTVKWLALENYTQDNRQIPLVQQKAKSWSHTQYTKQMAHELASNFAKSLEDKIISWTIEAQDFHLLSNEVRAKTYQTWNPIHLQNTKFRDACQNITNDDANIKAIAWLFGIWIANGNIQNSTMSIQPNDPNEIERIQNISKFNLLTTKLTQNQNESESRIDIQLNRNTDNGFSLWELLEELGLRNTHSKNIPTYFSREETLIRESFLAGIIDADGHVHQSQRHGHRSVSIETRYSGVRDGLVTLARSLAIRPSVSLKDTPRKDEKTFVIRFAACSALSNILSLCANSIKYVPAPSTVDRSPQKWYFDVKKMKQDSKQNQKLDIQNWSHEKIAWHLKRLNASPDDIIQKLFTNRHHEISTNDFQEFIQGKSQHSMVRLACEKYLLERWQEVQDNISLYEEEENHDLLGEYFGFTIDSNEVSPQAKNLFLLSNNVVAHNCIIFMDEIDAIGGKRFSEGTSADREIQRTLMELLNQLDGFKTFGQVKFIMATNRPDVLDQALLRPGRLDRKIEIPLPNEQGRLSILKIHSKSITKGGDIDYDAIVKLSDGFNGADLRNVCTEAGMFALRAERDYVIQDDFMKAVRKMADAKKLESKLES